MANLRMQGYLDRGRLSETAETESNGIDAPSGHALDPSPWSRPHAPDGPPPPQTYGPATSDAPELSHQGDLVDLSDGEVNQGWSPREPGNRGKPKALTNGSGPLATEKADGGSDQLHLDTTFQ